VTGTMLSPVTITSPTGQLYVTFTSDGSVNGAGFDATYTSQSSGAAAPTATPAALISSGCAGSSTEYIVAHNAKRTPVGLPTVVYSSTIEVFAQSWANALARSGCSMQDSTNAQRSSIAHGYGNGVGENLFWVQGLSPTWTSIVDAWWDEINNYAYGPSGNDCTRPGGVIGHFTQVAWQCSVYVGCARATCGSQTIAVCNYGVAGNRNNDLPFPSSVSVTLGKSGTPCASGGQAQTCSAPACLGAVAPFTPLPPSVPSVPSSPSSYPRCTNSAVQIMQDGSGSFSDGDGNYPPSSVCQFKIISSSPIVLVFDSLSVEQNYDFVKVYDGESNLSPMLAAVTGNEAQPITSTASIFITFTSDGSVQSSGFVASYRSASRRRLAAPLDEQDPEQVPIWRRKTTVAVSAVMLFVILMAVFLIVWSYNYKKTASLPNHLPPSSTKPTLRPKRPASMAGTQAARGEANLDQNPYHDPDNRKDGSALWT